VDDIYIHMKRFSEQFKKKAGLVTLTMAEKHALRERLSAYVEYHPLPVTMKKTSVRRGPTLFREPFIEWVMPRRLYRQLVLGCFVFMIVGVPLLAERAVPGDMLYSMKVRVNEEVRSSLTSSGYEKVVWETKRLERRVAEARVLAKEGKLTPEIEAEVIAAVTEHQAATAAEIETLRSTDAEAATLAAVTVASVLDVQAESLKMIDAEAAATEGMSTVALASVLDAAGEEVARTNTDTISYERLVAQLETETTRGRELLASIKDSATEQEYHDIERRLADIEGKVAAGAGLATTDTAAGAASLTQTWRDMQVIITFMTDIDVRTALAIETMVPVVLTPEEEKALALEAYSEASIALAKIDTTLPTVADAGINEKVSLTVPQIVALLETASTTIDSDVKGAKVAAFEAREYTRSIMSLAAFNDPHSDIAVMMIASEPASTTATSSDDVDATADEVPTPEILEDE
jgi:hypothetical protein